MAVITLFNYIQHYITDKDEVRKDQHLIIHI